MHINKRSRRDRYGYSPAGSAVYVQIFVIPAVYDMSITKRTFKDFNGLLKTAYFSRLLILYIGENAYLISLMKEAI